MSKTENLAVLAIACWVAFLVGKAHAAKAPAATTEPDAAKPATAGTSMDWFLSWGAPTQGPAQ